MAHRRAKPMADEEIRWFAQPDRKAIVIGGCARSGTTLVSSLLSSHSRVHVHGSNGFDRESGVFLDEAMDIRCAIARLMVDDPPAASTTHWCEKTPRNVHHVRRILDYFGDAGRFVNVVRDGRDVVTSIHPSGPDRYWVEPRRWVRDVAAGRPFAGEPRFLTVRYEDLVTNPAAILRTVCTFVGLPFEEGLLCYPNEARVRKSGAWDRLDARPLHPESIGRWREPRHRDAALELLKLPKAVEMLKAYGYL